MLFQAAFAQDQGTRAEQQDDARIHPADRAGSAELMGVLADGMGGMKDGAMAGRVAVTAFRDAFVLYAPRKGTVQTLQQAMHAANDAVLVFARGHKVASTLVAASVTGNHLHWIAVGDSRAYLIRAGQAYRLTVDHTFQEDQWWALRDAPNQLTLAGNAPPNPTAVSSFIGFPGGLSRFDASLAPVTLLPGDTVLLASDGMYNAIPESALPRYFQGDDVRVGCQQLVRAVMDMRVPDQDNVTVVAIKALGHGDEGHIQAQQELMGTGPSRSSLAR